MAVFQHEQLEVYRLAIEFMGNSVGMAARIPRQRWFMADQFLRGGIVGPSEHCGGRCRVQGRREGQFLPHRSPVHGGVRSVLWMFSR